MTLPRPISILSAMALLAAAGCASRAPLAPAPLNQDGLDRFLAGGRDARTYGITTYHDPAGPRFEFANRVHPPRAARVPFASPRRSSLPLLRAKSASSAEFHVLLDSSARQNWLLLSSVRDLDYRPFAPPLGEYPDHVLADVPGYAGVANKIIFDALHVESPIFYVPPADGGLGSLARAGEIPGPDPRTARDRRHLGAATHAILGAAAMRAFSFVRFDFPARTVHFSTDKTYAPADSAAVLANLPLREWRGRPAVQISLGAESLLAVLDTAGAFDLSLPDDAPPGPLALGTLPLDDVRPSAHAEHGLPPAFPPRIGLGVLARHAVTLDFKNRRVWIEGPPSSRATSSPSDPQDPTPPVNYRGVNR